MKKISKLFRNFFSRKKRKKANSEEKIIKEIIDKIEFKKIREKELSFNPINESDPYLALRIPKKEYSKKELLEIISNRITIIQGIESDKIRLKEEINIILDAYNAIIKNNFSEKKIDIIEQEKKLTYK